MSQFDSQYYLDNNEDVNAWWQDASQQGIHSGQGNYQQAKGRVGGSLANTSTDGWEQQWVADMNQKYGTSHSDAGQFSSDQFAQYHYDKWGRDNGRAGWGESSETPVSAQPITEEDPPWDGNEDFPAIVDDIEKPRQEAVERAQNWTNNSEQSIENNIVQNVGNKGDWTTNVGSNNTINNSLIGNDYSLNLGNINVANNQSSMFG